MAFFRLPLRAHRNRRRNKRSIPKLGSTVLIVDDSRTVRAALRKMLRQGGYETLEAENGQAAVDVAMQHKPAMVIMDVVMPVMTGYQATRKLRKTPETNNIPIVIMSGNKEAIEKFWVIRIGANDFMAKPFSRFEVFRRIEKILFQNDIL